MQILLAVNLISAISNNDLFGKTCLLVLFLISLYSLTIILSKWRTIRASQKQSVRFQQLVDGEGSWEALFVAAKKYPQSATADLFRQAYVECRMEKWFENHGELSPDGRIQYVENTMNSVLDRVLVSKENDFHSQMSILALVSGLAPFIGLLGTVWGILSAFQSIGDGGSAALNSLAPGISTALVTTIFGLFAAIPALVAHHYFSGKILTINQQMESFANDLENAVRKQILSGRGAPK